MAEWRKQYYDDVAKLRQEYGLRLAKVKGEQEEQLREYERQLAELEDQATQT